MCPLLKTYLTQKLGEKNWMKYTDPGIITDKPDEIKSDTEYFEINIVIFNVFIIKETRNNKF